MKFRLSVWKLQTIKNAKLFNIDTANYNFKNNKKIWFIRKPVILIAYLNNSLLNAVKHLKFGSLV